MHTVTMINKRFKSSATLLSMFRLAAKKEIIQKFPNHRLTPKSKASVEEIWLCTL
jgi:hypothetical protein